MALIIWLMKGKVSSLKIIKMENMYELLMLISIRLNSYSIDRQACEYG